MLIVSFPRLNPDFPVLLKKLFVFLLLGDRYLTGRYISAGSYR